MAAAAALPPFHVPEPMDGGGGAVTCVGAVVRRLPDGRGAPQWDAVAATEGLNWTARHDGLDADTSIEPFWLEHVSRAVLQRTRLGVETVNGTLMEGRGWPMHSMCISRSRMPTASETGAV